MSEFPDKFPETEPVLPSQTHGIDKLFEALSTAQGMMEGAKKDQKNPHFKSTFAGLSATWEAIRAALSKNGLAVVQTTEITPNGIVLVTTLGHKSGQWIRGWTPLIVDRQGMQPLGSAITYARRYGLQGVTGIAPVDDDGEEATDHGKKDEPVHGALTKTKLQGQLRAFDVDLHRVSDEDELEGLLASYDDVLGQAWRDLPSWMDTKPGSDVLGINDRIAQVRKKLQSQEAFINSSSTTTHLDKAADTPSPPAPRKEDAPAASQPGKVETEGAQGAGADKLGLPDDRFAAVCISEIILLKAGEEMDWANENAAAINARPKKVRDSVGEALRAQREGNKAGGPAEQTEMSGG